MAKSLSEDAYSGCAYDKETDEPRRDLETPLLKDVIQIWQRTWVVLRIEATRPGYWYFHCPRDLRGCSRAPSIRHIDLFSFSPKAITCASRLAPSVALLPPPRSKSVSSSCPFSKRVLSLSLSDDTRREPSSFTGHETQHLMLGLQMVINVLPSQHPPVPADVPSSGWCPTLDKAPAGS